MYTDKIKQFASKYLEAGFSVIPVTGKNPAVKSWGQYIYKPMDLSDVDTVFGPRPEGIALLMGGKKKLTTIDIDSKYDLTGEVFNNLKKEIGPSLLKRLTCHTTVNGGYHLIFSCSVVEGNTKLASRPVTPSEKIDTLSRAIEKGAEIDTALQTALADNSRVIIETRGEGGYILVPPTTGYSHVYGKIQEITPEEYHSILDICRSFNTYIPNVKNYQLSRVQRSGEDKSNTFKNFNENCDILELLKSFGWETVGTSPDGYTKVKRPGAASTHSAYYNHEDRSFWVFTTSTGFEANKKYGAVDILLMLKYQNDGARLNDLLKEIKDLGY